jgi:Ca2+/Na+ antiporter
VVGAPPKVDEAVVPTVALAQAPRKPLDKRIKRELFSLILSTVIFFVVSTAMLLKPNPDWSFPALFMVVIAFAAFRYLKVRRQVEAESKRAQGGAIG